MAINSMTGFARVEGGIDNQTWIWEVRSVNAKGLDVRFRPPQGFEVLDPVVRERLKNVFKRGSFSVSLATRRQDGASAYRINDDFLREVVDRLPDLKARVPEAAPPSLDGLMGLRGVIEPVEEILDEDTFDRISTAMAADLDMALVRLAEMRAEEGRRLHDVLSAQIDEIADLSARAETLVATHPDAIRARLKEQVEQLLADTKGLGEDRLIQEAALLMTKADVREEIDRLKSHVTAARELMAKDAGPIGRRFDFLCQEFNREANTLCSKSPDTELTAVGLDLKTVIDQLREQVQNIE